VKIISLFDYSGNWSKPWRKEFEVIQIDIKLGIDILIWNYKNIEKNNVYGILAAIPCTDYALSGAKHFKIKDRDGRTEKSNLLVKKTMEIINYFNPKFWVVENPMSRIHKLNPELGRVKFKFHPYEFAGWNNNKEEQYQKTTWLFGNFTSPEKKPLPNVLGQKLYRNYGGKSERTKELRSITPMGFSKAFFEANKIQLNKTKILDN